VKIISNYNTRKEQSSSNTSTVPAYSGKNKLLMKYLDTPKFEKDLERARLEKGEVK